MEDQFQEAIDRIDLAFLDEMMLALDEEEQEEEEIEHGEWEFALGSVLNSCFALFNYPFTILG